MPSFASLLGALPLPFMNQQQADAEEASNASEEGRGQQQTPTSQAHSSSSHPFPQFFLPPVPTTPAAEQAPSLALVTSGTRLYGSPNRMDPRTFLGIKIYDFAVYADLEQLRKVNALHHQPQQQHQQQHQQLSSGVLSAQGSVAVDDCANAKLARRPPAWLAAPRSAFQGISSACSWLGSTVLDNWGFDNTANMDSSEAGPESSLRDIEGSSVAACSKRERRLHKRTQRQQQRQEKRQQRESGRCERRSARALRRRGGRAGGGEGGDLGEHAVSVLKRSPCVPVSIVLRAARDLPVALLQAEMGRVLQSRIVKAGGSEDAAELPLLLECFSSHRLPRECWDSNSKHSSKHTHSSISADGEAQNSEAHTASHSGSKSGAPGSEVVVKQGSVLVFSRDAQGCLSATALTHAGSPNAAVAEGGMLGAQGGECASVGVGGGLIGGSGSSNNGSNSSNNSSSGEFGMSSGSGFGGSWVSGNGVNGGVVARMPMGGAAWGEGSAGVGLLEEPLRCAPLCAALLDVYLGSPPVCRKAKASAEAFLAHTISGPQPTSGKQGSRGTDKGSSECKAGSSSSAMEQPLPAFA